MKERSEGRTYVAKRSYGQTRAGNAVPVIYVAWTFPSGFIYAYGVDATTCASEQQRWVSWRVGPDGKPVAIRWHVSESFARSRTAKLLRFHRSLYRSLEHAASVLDYFPVDLMRAGR